MVWVWLFSIILWWAHVTVIPDASRIAVFKSGICIGLNGLIPIGGQIIPNSIVGASLLWKNAQKNEMKKNTSDTINKIIPHRKPMLTIEVCIPW